MKLINRLRPAAGELFIMLTMLIFLSNLLWRGQVINSDGLGYYDYLPSVFIYNDLHKTEKETTANPVYHDLRDDYLVEFEGRKVDKYPCGVAVMISPIFLAAHAYALISNNEADGYTKPYQFSVFLAALLFGFAGLLYLRKLLQFYTSSPWLIFVVQAITVFATAIPHFIYFDSSYSHIYSFFAVTAFLYHIKAFSTGLNRNNLIAAGILYGLIVILRQPNGIILVFIPFLLGSWNTCKSFIRELFSRIGLLLVAVASAGLVMGIQLLAWYVQTGHPLVYSYQGEGFNFLHPEIINVLFSYRKGLFIYTPVLLIAMAGSLYWIKEKRYFEFAAWFLFFLSVTYIISAWWCWHYGCSYGQRPYVDFYSVFSFPLLNLLQHARLILRLTLALVLAFVVYLNIIQTWQYKSYIFDWIEMDRTKYWEVFLRQETKYRGLFWKKDFSSAYQESALVAMSSNRVSVQDGKETSVFATTIPDTVEKTLLKIRMQYAFPHSDNSTFQVKLSDTAGTEMERWNVPFIHLHNAPFNTMQSGTYQLEIPECPECSLSVSIDGKEYTTIPEIQISLHANNND